MQEGGRGSSGAPRRQALEEFSPEVVESLLFEFLLEGSKDLFLAHESFVSLMHNDMYNDFFGSKILRARIQPDAIGTSFGVSEATAARGTSLR